MDSKLKKILLVEDEQDAREAVEEMLRSDGLSVKSVSESQAGLKALLDNPNEFSMVLLDRLMPEMDGLRFLDEMRQHDALAKTPVIMISDAEDHEAIAEAVSKGVFDFLDKPIHKPHLLELVSLATV
jgi:two-component system, NtrC family, nitrogen regulation response regulator NtrX